MDAKDELLTIAQLAVALIGFSGLIFVFRARDATGLEPRDLSGIGMIAGAGALALAFALLPLPLAYVGLPAPTFWRLCSGLFGTALLAAAAVFSMVSRRLARLGHPARTPRLNRTTVVLILLLGVALLLPALGLAPANPALYLLGLVLCVLLCLTFVGFMLVVARRAGDR